MSEVKVNKITPTANCGTVTLGDSGDTFSLPAGVTLSNAGSITNSGTITNTGTISGGTITGTIDNQVNWDTTAKTAGFTAVAGNGYFVNTTSGAITVTLPATPTAGDLVGIKDYANTANTNNITVDRNGSNIQGVANNFVINVAGTSITLIYVDGTQGWVSTGVAKASDITEQATFITATGGCISYCGDYKIHTFNSPGTFCVSSIGNPLGGPNSVDYLVIAGGAGGGCGGGGGAGAGGAGGYRTSYPSPAGVIPVTAQGYPIAVGAGGASAPYYGDPGDAGSNSVFSTITSSGGGGGGGHPSPTPNNPSGEAGGSGGGGAGFTTAPYVGSGGAGNTPPVSPPQGNPGGNGTTNPVGTGGGGGGAGGSGGAGGPGAGGAGGSGLANSITGSSVTRGGGGGGATGPAASGGSPGPGGSGGGGAGGTRSSPNLAQSGTANTGGGGGGAACNGNGDGNGGSGVVIIRYKYQ
jgi:hypothetical protein